MRIVLLIFLFTTSVLSFSNDPIISKIEVSKDALSYIDISKIENEEEFFQQFYMKIFLDKEIIKDKKYFIRLLHNYENIKDINVNAFRDDNELIIEVDKSTKNSIVIHIDTTDTKAPPYLSLEIFDEENFKDVLDGEKLYFGLVYGIVFCAFLYNFILFIFNREKSFLYYSLLQVSLLFLLLTHVMTLDFLKPLYKYIFLPEFVGQIALIFALLFNRAFLDSKKFIPRVDAVLLLLIVFSIADTLIFLVNGETILDEYFPTSLLLAILVFSSFLVYRQGYKVAIFYILGWSIIFISVFLIEYDFLPFSDVYALYIGLPLESLILSFSLGYKIKELERKKAMHEQMVIHQNKLASMGQMLNNIAHQYRQPLTHLGYILMNINSAHEHGELDKQYLDKKIKQANKQLIFMSDTIDSFKDFYKPTKEKEMFYINEAVSSAIFIVKPILEENSVKLEVNIDKNIQILGYENEYSQVVLNLLTNAKDSLIENNIKDAKIEVKLEKSCLYIKDNSIGVPIELEQKIFEPYFTTKEKSSGIGLYMSMLIMQEHFNAKILLKNSSNGATFIIEV